MIQESGETAAYNGFSHAGISTGDKQASIIHRKIQLHKLKKVRYMPVTDYELRIASLKPVTRNSPLAFT
jgi:hypothetical protein